MEIHYLAKLRRWLWLIILVTIVCGATAFLFVKNQPVLYEANTKLLIGPGVDSADPDLNSLRAGGQLLQTYAELVATGPMLQTVIDTLHLDTDIKALARKIDVKYNVDTQIMSITVKDEDPTLSAAIANAVADALVEISPSSPDSTSANLIRQMKAQVKELEAAIPTAQENIKRLEKSYLAFSTIGTSSATVENEKKLLEQQLNSEREHLAELRSSLTTIYETLGNANTNQVKIIEKAVASSNANDNSQLYVLAAGMAGFLLGLAFALAIEYFDDTIKSGRELEDLTGLPILATITSQVSRDSVYQPELVVIEKPESQASEIYRQLGTRLLPALKLNEQDIQKDSEKLDQPVAEKTTQSRSLMISSLQAGDDASEVAANLALIISQIGVKTILVDSDLHQPKLDELFSVTTEKGLLKVLDNNSRVNLTDNLVQVSPNLSILPKGSASSSMQEYKSTFELLVSGNMMDMLKRIKSKAKAIILVSPPLTLYSETMILASRVDGVILVGYKDRLKRKLVLRAIEDLKAFGIKPLGIVMKEDQPKSLWKNSLIPNSKVLEKRQPLVVEMKER